MINCFVFKPPAPYCLIRTDQIVLSLFLKTRQAYKWEVLLYYGTDAKQKSCVLCDSNFLFCGQYLVSAIVIYATNPDMSSTFCHMEVILVFVSSSSKYIYLSSWSIISHLNFFFFGQLATKLITARVSSDGGINKQSPLTWAKGYLTSVCVNAASACASLFRPAGEVFTCLKMHKST